MPETDLARSQRPHDGDHTVGRAPSAPTPARSAEFRRLGQRWMAEKAAVLADIAGSPDLSGADRESWCGALTKITVTDEDEAAFGELLAAVRLRAVTVALTGSYGAWRRLSGVVDGLGRLRVTRAEARAAR